MSEFPNIENGKMRTSLFNLAVCIVEGVVGSVFVYSGLIHLVNPYLFAFQIAGYELLPLALVLPVAFLLPGLMTVCGVCLVLRNKPLVSLRILCGLSFLFSFAQIYALVFDLEINCGCFGFSSNPITATTVLAPVCCFVSTLVLMLISRQDHAEPESNRVSLGAVAGDSC